MGRRQLPDAYTHLPDLARTSIEAALRGEEIAPPGHTDPALVEPRGAFVTLQSNGRLRGCIGRIESSWPLWETVARMARAAAFEDPRFPALGADELDRLTVEVSVLSPMSRVDSPESVVPGEHGVMISLPPRGAVFLPQVATEQGWDRDMLLTQLCLKAGIAPDAWRGDEVELFVFRADVVEEPTPGD